MQKIKRVAETFEVLTAGEDFMSTVSMDRITVSRTIHAVTPTLGFRVNLDMYKIIDLLALLVTFNRGTLRTLLQRR